MPTGVYVRTKEYREIMSNVMSGRKINWANKISESQLGSKANNWNGGKCKNKLGYVLLYLKPSQRKERKRIYIREHRWVMEQELGRKLKSDELVHHINGVRDDNSLENLQIVSRARHRELHNIVGKKQRRGGV